MKTNKKAILGFAITMIFSLAIMQGMSLKSNQQDITIQQIGAGAAYGAANTEGGTSAILSYTAGLAQGTAAGMTAVGLGSIYITGTNPVGWGYWVATAGVAL